MVIYWFHNFILLKLISRLINLCVSIWKSTHKNIKVLHWGLFSFKVQLTESQVSVYSMCCCLSITSAFFKTSSERTRCIKPKLCMNDASSFTCALSSFVIFFFFPFFFWALEVCVVSEMSVLGSLSASSMPSWSCPTVLDDVDFFLKMGKKKAYTSCFFQNDEDEYCVIITKNNL